VPRYIDADEAKKNVFETIIGASDFAVDTRRAAYDAIDAAHTADVAPVRRGEWEVAIGYDPNKKVQCQNCYKMAYEPTPYCPNCGADMRKERP